MWFKEVTMVCDRCGVTRGTAAHTVKEARELLAGWKHRDGNDYCPRCS